MRIEDTRRYVLTTVESCKDLITSSGMGNSLMVGRSTGVSAGNLLCVECEMGKNFGTFQAYECDPSGGKVAMVFLTGSELLDWLKPYQCSCFMQVLDGDYGDRLFPETRVRWGEMLDKKLREMDGEVDLVDRGLKVQVTPTLVTFSGGEAGDLGISASLYAQAARSEIGDAWVTISYPGGEKTEVRTTTAEIRVEGTTDSKGYTVSRDMTLKILDALSELKVWESLTQVRPFDPFEL